MINNRNRNNNTVAIVEAIVGGFGHVVQSLTEQQQQQH